MGWLILVPLIALTTSLFLLWLAVVDIRDDWKRPRWRIRKSLDVIALSAGLVCMILTALYALIQ